jgi:transposase
VQFVLACKSKDESFASLCRGFGISRKTGYKWLKRYRVGGVKALENASRRPRHRGKMYHFSWRERLRRARPDWGAKKLRWGLEKAFPRARRIPTVSTLARWLVECNLVKKRKRRARPGPVLPGRGVRAAKSCNEVWTIDFKGWFRTGDGRRCEPLTVRDLHSRYMLGVVLLNNQSDAGVRRALAQIFRRYGLPRVIRVDNGAPFGGNGALGLSRLSVWWARLGITVDFVRPAHPQGQRRARTNASRLESQGGHSPCVQYAGAEATSPSLDGLLQSRASSRSFGPASAGGSLSAESSPDAVSAPRAEISATLESAAGAQSWAHQMAGAPTLCWASLCRRTGGTEHNKRWHPRNLPRAAIDWLALRPRSNGNAAGLYHAAGLMFRVCPPRDLNGPVWESAPEQTAAPPSSCWLVCSDALQASASAKV